MITNAESLLVSAIFIGPNSMSQAGLNSNQTNWNGNTNRRSYEAGVFSGIK